MLTSSSTCSLFVGRPIPANDLDTIPKFLGDVGSNPSRCSMCCFLLTSSANFDDRISVLSVVLFCFFLLFGLFEVIVEMKSCDDKGE